MWIKRIKDQVYRRVWLWALASGIVPVRWLPLYTYAEQFVHSWCRTEPTLRAHLAVHCLRSKKSRYFRALWLFGGTDATFIYFLSKENPSDDQLRAWFGTMPDGEAPSYVDVAATTSAIISALGLEHPYYQIGGAPSEEPNPYT